MSASAEIRRLRYLKAMGVTAYVTRRSLPGAAVSNRLAYRSNTVNQLSPSQGSPGPGASGGHPSGTSGSEQSPRSGHLAAKALRESLRADVRQPAEEALHKAASIGKSPSSTAGKAQPEAATRFRLAAVICARRLWLEALGNEALAREQVLLISAMGRALSHPQVHEDAPLVTEFRWPLHDNAQLGLGAEEATATLQGFLYRQLEEHACVELICLGESSKSLLGSIAVPCARRYVPATRDMLRTPLLKRDSWAALQA